MERVEGTKDKHYLSRSPHTFQNIQKACSHILLSVQQDPDNIYFYSDPTCLCSLYKVLLACVLNPSKTQTPPTQIAIQIFSTGQQHCNLQVCFYMIYY